MLRYLEQLGWVVRLVVFATLVFAASSKIVAMSEFARALAAWRLVPDMFSPAFAVVIVLIEIALPMYRLISNYAVWPELLTVFLLVGLTAAYVTESLVAEPPNCSCFGLLAAHISHEQGLWQQLARNAVLLGLLIAGMWSRGCSTPES